MPGGPACALATPRAAQKRPPASAQCLAGALGRDDALVSGGCCTRTREVARMHTPTSAGPNRRGQGGVDGKRDRPCARRVAYPAVRVRRPCPDPLLAKRSLWRAVIERVTVRDNKLRGQTTYSRRSLRLRSRSSSSVPPRHRQRHHRNPHSKLDPNRAARTPTARFRHHVHADKAHARKHARTVSPNSLAAQGPHELPEQAGRAAQGH